MTETQELRARVLNLLSPDSMAYDWDAEDERDPVADPTDKSWGESVSLFCNDVFFWGCADSELVERKDLEELTRACDEVRGVTGNIDSADLLFISRKRNLRPQGALYSYIDKSIWHLFNDLPEREVGFGNPCPADGSYGKSKQEAGDEQR